jgi:hypothetical protein
MEHSILLPVWLLMVLSGSMMVSWEQTVSMKKNLMNSL